jgi:hypothetical protein
MKSTSELCNFRSNRTRPSNQKKIWVGNAYAEAASFAAHNVLTVRCGWCAYSRSTHDSKDGVGIRTSKGDWYHRRSTAKETARATSEAIVNLVVAEAIRFPFECSQWGDLWCTKSYAWIGTAKAKSDESDNVYEIYKTVTFRKLRFS